MKPAEKDLNFFLAAFFLSGLLPAPGTMASALCCLAVLAFPSFFGPGACLAVCAAAVAAAFVVIPPVLARTDETDPSEIVIDEAAGQFLALAGCLPAVAGDALWVLAAFGLFRALDILKPWPVCALERLPGALGIMADDLLCGIVAFVLLRGAQGLAAAVI